MSPDKFWLKFNNTNKEELKEAKHGIRKDQIAPKYHNLFDGYDANNDGVLENKEIRNMYTHLKNFAGDDNTLDEAENLKAKSVFAQKANLPDSDFMGFVKSISDAAAEIVSTKEKYTRDGGKEVTTEYKDGTIQTVAYYKNGDFKWKKTKKHIKTTTFEMEINGQKKEISEEEFNKAKNRLQKDGKTGNIKGAEGQTQTLSSGISSDNVKISTNTTERDKHTEEFSPRFIVDNFGIDTETEEGLKMVERLSFIPKDALSTIKDGKEVSELLTQNDLEADFDNISNILEIVYGITLRTEEEYEASKEKRELLISQIQTIGIMSELYAAVAQYNDDYTDSQGLYGMGSEGFGWLLNKCGIQGENHYQWANSCREFIEKINSFKVLNPEKFQKEFEKLTGKNNFNTQALQKMIALSKDGKAQDKDGNYTEEYKEAVKAFSNFDISNPNAKAWYHPDNLLNGFGEALTMIFTLGWGAETQGGKILAASAMSTFSRLGVNVASRQAKNKLLQGALRLSGQGIKLIGPAINEGTKMYLYTAATGTATNITNRAAKFDSEENSLERLLDTEAAVLDGAVGSFSFGAFAGVFGSTVTQKVMQIASRTSQKVGTALAGKFAAGAVNATDAYITILEKSMPTKVAEAVAFATDVFGFTAFESALAIYHASNDPKKYPNGISAEDLTTILWDEFKGQGVNLGQIKGVSYLIMWLTGSRSARMQASKYMRNNIPQLKGSTLEQTENGYKIKLPNGKTVNCKNETEMISSLHLMVRGETAFSKRFDNNFEKDDANIGTSLSESSTTAESNQKITTIEMAKDAIEKARSRDDLAPVREFLQQMAAGEEKTELQIAYQRKAMDIQKNESQVRKNIHADLRSSDFEDMDIEDIHYEAEKMLQDLPHDLWKDMKNPSWSRAVELIAENTNKYNIVILRDLYAKFFATKDGLEQNDTPFAMKKILEGINNATTSKLVELILKRNISLKNFKDYIELCNEDPEFAYKLYKSEKPIINYSISEIYSLCNEGQCSQETVNSVLNTAIKNRIPHVRGVEQYLNKIPSQYYDVVEMCVKEGMSETDILVTLNTLKDFTPEHFETLREINIHHPEWIEGLQLEDYKFAKTLEEFEVGYNAISEIDDAIFEKIPNAKGYVYIQAIHVNDHWTSPRTYSSRIENLYKIAKYDEKTAQQLFKLMDELETKPENDAWDDGWEYYIDHLDKAAELHNLDYAAEYIKNHNYKFSTFIKKVVQSDIDITKTEAVYNDIQAKKEQIVKEVKIKCKDTSPEFAFWVESFLNSSNSKSLMFIDNLNIKDLIDNFFYTSKIIKAFEQNPSNYINGQHPQKIIDAYTEYRQFGNNSPKFKSLNSIERRQVTSLSENVKRNFDSQFQQIFRAICATDIETVKLLFDKRLENFKERITDISNIPDTYKPILADLIRNGKRLNKNGQPDKLSGQQKVELINTVSMYALLAKKGGIELNLEQFKKPLDNGTFILNFEGMRRHVFNTILSNMGMPESEISSLKSENLKWDTQHIYLLTQHVIHDEGELATLVTEASKGSFQDFIKSPDNPHGAANVETEKMFAQEKLNYDAWQNGIQEKKIQINGKEYTIKLWNRIPQESLFDGTYTSCCTALDGGNGGSMANYMLNTAINVIEVRDSSGKVIAMSRCYVAKTNDGKPSLIIENIEVNNSFNDHLHLTNSELDLSENIFDYMKNFADAIGGKNMPVYMSTSFVKLSEKILDGYKPASKKIALVGKISKSEIYLNTFGEYVDPSHLNKIANFRVIRDGDESNNTPKTTVRSGAINLPSISGKTENDDFSKQIPPEKIQRLFEKTNGKQNVINNLQKLIDADCSYGVLSDIVHRLDVPEHIVETYIQKFKETNCDIGYSMFTLINSLQDGAGLRSDYKEVFDYTLKLFDRTTNGKKLNASQVAELMRYGRGDKKDIDLIIEYMNINELKDNSLTPKDVADLIPVIKNGDVNIKTRITQVAKLSPEQLASRDNKPLDGNTIKEILEIENLTDEKLELIKSVLCDKNLQENSNISDNLKIRCVEHLNFNEHLIDLFKDLITTDLHPANMFGKKSLSFISVCDIVKNYPNKEDIATIKKLFELKADGKNGKRLQERDFEPSIISRDDLAKMREYMEAVKDNEDLMNHLSFQIVTNEKRMQSILEKLQENPNITYDKIVMEVDILPKIKHIENKALYNLALEVEKRGLKTTSDLIQEVSYKIDGVEDKYLNDRINTFLKEVLDYLKKGTNECYSVLPMIDSWLDVYHTLKGDYEYIGTKDNPTYKRALYEFAKENEPQRAEELNRAIQEGRFDSDNEEWSDIMRDFAMEAGIERLRTFLKDYPHDQMGEHLYKQYYLKTVPAELASKCEKIFEKYGTNIFLSSENNPELAKTVLDFIDAELNEWKEKSNGTCVFPPVIDFSKAKRDYVDEERAYGDGTAAAFAEAGATESISIDGYDRTVYTLRHEMTHINDLKKGYETDIQYNIEEIMPRKIDENGKEVIDIKNCKYKEEFLKAGINPKQIKYAYNNIQEFIAVAAEGDMSKYSPEFKKILINFGMPEWVLNMEVTDPAIKTRSEIVSYLIETAKQYDITQDGKKVDIEKEPILILDLISDYAKCEKLSELASKEFRRHNVPNDPKKLFEYCFARKDKDEIFNDLSKIKDILLSDNTNKTSEHPTITMPAHKTINKEVENSVRLTDKALPQASQDNKFTIGSDGNDVIRPLTGKETLETLYKIKAETDKIIEQLIKDHEEFRNGEHTLREKFDESDKFFEIKRAHEKYQEAVNTVIELAERIAYEETVSKIEKEFPTIDKEKAEAVLKEALNKYSSGNDWYSSSLLRECTIEDKVSEELVNRTVEMLKQGISDLSMIRQFIELFTNKNGIDRAAIETYDKLWNGEYKGKNGLLIKLLEACKDREDNKFRLDYYEKFKQITADTRRSHDWVRNIFRSCEKIHVTPDSNHSYFYLDEALWAKAIELKEMGFDTYDISCLMDFCRDASDISTKRMTEFSQERFNLILELKDKYNVSLDNISSILRECDHDGEFNKGEYETAIALKGHVKDEDISGYIDILQKVENKELAIKHLDELQQKYGVSSRRVMFLYRACCDVIKDADGKEKTYKFNPLKYEKAIELKEKYNVDDFDLQHFIKTCTVGGKFEEVIFNKIVEFKEKYGFEDEILNRIIGGCIHPAEGESSWEQSIIDYKLLDKIGVWTDLYIKSSDEVSEILQVEKNHDFREIGHNLTNILERITSVDCEATDYIEKFIQAGMVKIQTRLNEVVVRDENGYITNPPHYNTEAMDIMLEWANKYHLEDEQFSSVMNRINTQTKLPKEEAMKCINQLYKAGWDPKNTDSFRAIIEHWGHNGSREFELDAINLFTEYLHKGFTTSVIEQAIYSCSKRGKNEATYYNLDRTKLDKTLEMVRYVHGDYKHEAAGWMHYFSDYSDSMIKILYDHHFRIPFKEFYDFARQDICNIDVMNDPKKLARVPQILEQIAQHPESFNDIKEIWLDRNFPHNDKYFNFCFRHLKDSEWKKCFDAWKNLENGRGFHSGLLIDILDALDNDKMPLMPTMEWKGRIPEPVLSTIQSSGLRNNIKRYAFAICQQIDRYNGDGVNNSKYCPEVIEKIKELMLNGELSTILLSTGGTTLVFDNPEFCKVLDALAKAEREGLGDSLIACAFHKIRGGSNVRDNHFAQNYQEIIDFYVRHKNILNADDIYKPNEAENKNTQIYNLIYSMQTEDVDLLEKTMAYAQKLENPSVIKTIGELIVRQQNKDSYYNHEIDIKPILDFLDKVDLEKYEKEVSSLLYQMTEGQYAWENGNLGYMDKLFDSNLSKESIEFILETEKLLSKSSNTDRPYLTNTFFNLFLGEKIPDEALNKLQFYLEYQASMINNENKEDIPFEVVGTGEKHGYSSINLDEIIKFVRLYKLSPDRIEFFEKYLFGTEEEADFINHIVTYLSKDEALLSEELKFLDEVLSYEYAIDSKYRIDEILQASTGENFEAKMEVWNLIKPKKKKLAKGELSRKLYMLLGVETFNKEVFLTAYSQNRFDDVALGNLIGHTKTSNKDLILEMLNDKKYTPEFINNIALFTNNPTRADIAKQMLKDGTFTEDQIKNILNATTEKTEALTRELCFNKEINFPKEHIFDVLWACTDINEQLAWKLCTSKIKQIPVDKIPLAMSCYKNKNTNLDMYINKFKMFLDLEFSDDFIKSILGTSGSISRYTKNFCTVLQHLQQQGLKAEKCVEILTSDTLSDNITQNIDALEILNLVGSEDIKLLQADGIDIYDKIQKLQKAIDVKHPIIGVQKGNEIGTLKALANNGDADRVIRTMDLTQFTPHPNPLPKGAREIYQGIPLQYTREEFMQNMSRLITEYTSGESDKLRGLTSVERKPIPDLELSEEAQEKVKQKIEEFSYQYHNRTQDEEIILDGKKCHGVRFRGSKTNGSNAGDFYLIDGKLFYVKTPTSDKLGQSVEEVIASRLYRAAGIDAPNEHYIFDKNGEVIGMASEYVPDMQPRNWSSASEAETKLMFESFAVDAWLANWDAPCNDNTQLYDNGKIIKSDVGGSMHYHARGTIKTEFNGTVIELLSLIEHNSFYSKMTKQDVLNSIKRVIDIPDATIYQTIMQSPSRDTKLAETMIRRKAYLQKFYDNLEKLEEGSQNIVDLIIEAQGKTVTDFKEIPDIAGAFGYIQTENGFEGLLNTQGSDKLQLTPEQKAVADKIKAEIERFTIHNRVADNADIPQEVRVFVNSILQGVPEFAPYFGKPQHGGHQYSLDIHILNVLQKSLNNPLYDAVDKDGFKLLDDESKMVLKFSALLHDIGKMHMSGKDEGHAERSAEYVYSILDRFNLPKRVKNRIINIVNNHHWFEQLCTGAIQENTVASMFRTTSDFTIARIMAQSDLESVHEGYFTSRMSRNFPKEVSNEASAYKKFNSIMDNIQAKVTQIEESSAVVTPSKWVEVAEHIGSDGKVVPRRGFPLVDIELDGKIEQFRILNLNDLDPETDMYQYGFNHIKLKDLKLLVHRFGDGEWGKFTTTKILGDNPSRFSVQSLSLINPAHTSAYSGRNFSCIMEGNNANIGVAYYQNAGTGTRKNLSNLEEELFGSHFEKKRNFFKKEFLQFMEKRGIKLNDHQYGIIMRYARNKRYIETQLQDLNLGSVTIKRQDLVDGLLAAQEVLIEKQKYDHYEAHNEETLIDCNVIAGGASLKNIEELQKNPEFLRLCRDNCNGTIILW